MSLCAKSKNNNLKFVNSGKPVKLFLLDIAIIIPVVKTPIIGNNNFATRYIKHFSGLIV